MSCTLTSFGSTHTMLASYPSKANGSSTCRTVAKNGSYRAECEVCDFASEWFANAKSAARSGNAHSKKHVGVAIAIPLEAELVEGP